MSVRETEGEGGSVAAGVCAAALHHRWRIGASEASGDLPVFSEKRLKLGDFWVKTNQGPAFTGALIFVFDTSQEEKSQV